MPTCQACGEQWTWKQTFKKMFTLDTSMICPYCDRKQYFSAQSRRKMSMLGFIPPLLLLIPLLFDINPFVMIMILIGTTMIYLGILPRLIDLSNHEEPHW